MNIEKIGIVGHLEIEEVCKETGRVELVVDERNVIVTTGFQTFLGGISNKDQYQFGFDGIYLGDDVGDGTLEEPTPADKFTTSGDQHVVHRVSNESVWTNYPAYNKLRFTSVVDGHEIFLNTGEPRNVFTSASIRNKRNEVVAYKRFAGRVTSPMLSLNIRWTLTVVDQCLDIPTRFVTNVVFYVMRNWSEQPNTDILHPEEISMGTGFYTKEVILGSAEREVYIIALQEWDNGTITAIEWDSGVPITPNTISEFDSSNATLTQVSPYVVKIRMKTDKLANTLKICSEGVCDILNVRNTTIYPQTWNEMTPIGERPESEWSDARFWKLMTKNGATLGTHVIGEMNDPNQHEWQYWVDGNEIVLYNPTTTQHETRTTSGRVRHVHAGFDNQHRPIIVWQIDRDSYVNSWDEASVGYKTEKLTGMITPVVVTPSANANLSGEITPVVAYVNYVTSKMYSMAINSQRTVVQIGQDVIDILACGLTPLNNYKLVYTKRVGGLPVIMNMATDRLGGYVGSGIMQSSLSCSVQQVGLIDNSITIGE